ncbi:MAG TPA: hypothetical protein VEQ10_15260 [Vicinamibacteria bacterium]|nr:hypothetical protein [Vicinamibacteria bacterium]
MSSLAERLAFLSQAVPALPGKVDAVAHEADALDKAARDAIAEFHQKREQASQLVDQLRHALEELRDQVADERQQVEQAVHALQDAAAQEGHELDEGAQQLQGGAAEAGTAIAALQSSLSHAGDQTRAAHEEAHAALHALAEHAHAKRPQLEAAVHDVTAAVKSTEEAVRQGETLVNEGVSALKDAMARLLQDVRERLQQTHVLLDDLHAQQQDAVADALKELEAQTEHLENDLPGRVDTEMEQPLEHQFDGLAGALAEAGQQVKRLLEDCSTRREVLEQQVATMADRIPPLQGAVPQVKGAAERVGVPWP